MRVEFGTFQKRAISNLTKLYKIILNIIQNQKELQMLLVDKNLGPMLVSRDDCVKAIADQHFSDMSTYEIISMEEVQEHFLEATNSF